MSTGTPPPIPASLLPYESYTEDPKWQIRFTAMWCAALGLAILLAAPRALSLRSIRESASGLLGVRVRGEYEALPQEEEDGKSESASAGDVMGTRTRAGVPVLRRNVLTTAWRILGSLRLWSLPGITLNVGQILVVAGYGVFALICIVKDVPLVVSPNRAGFLALAQLPPVFLFASKNSPLTALLLGPGVDYTKLNYIHRWSARGLFLGAVLHGALWINNHLVYDLPILSQQKEGSGVAALGVLCVIVLSSIAPLRRWCYSAFLVIHFLTFPAFFITVCYHTIYAPPWIFPPLAFYGADLLLRIFRWRVVVARVHGLPGGMTLIHVPRATAGWRAGQHVQMRALVGGRAWEAHPLSVCCAAPEVTCLSGPGGEPLGMLLAARACGDWSGALRAFACVPLYLDEEEEEEEGHARHRGESGEGDVKRALSPAEEEGEKEKELPGREAHLVLEGPYGGPTLRATDFETVLLFAGGSGATFTLGVLDDLVGRCFLRSHNSHSQTHNVKTRRIEWCWCVRSFGAINWFAPFLLQIATRAAQPASGVQLTIRIFVTCLCDPDAVPLIPGCVVLEGRPGVGGVLGGLVGACVEEGEEGRSSEESEEGEEEMEKEMEKGKGGVRVSTDDVEKGVGSSAYTQGGGGVAVFAAGPGSLIREAGNAVARANLGFGARGAGGVAFCAEAFTI
ncbi:hypothetical protein B0H11DRAFT_2275407 [Mycena galericulata]|nr:hypothetical protein B0H11DRAFT_2275407 [Mycena galericulata]